MGNGVHMESVEDIDDNDFVMDSVQDTNANSTRTSIVEFNIYYPPIDILKDPELFQKDQLFNDLTTTDDSHEKNHSFVYYSDNKFNTKLGRDRATLFSMNMKYRPGIVFSDIKDFDSYLPKYYLKEDSIEWSNAKQQAL